MGNAFVHIELNTEDVDSARQFYKKLFDWKLSEMQGGGMPYTMIDVGKGGTGGGMQKKPMPEAPNNWLPYIAVASVQKTADQAAAAGGRILAGPAPIPGMGAYAVLTDPTGAAFGVWEMAPPPPPAKKAAAKKPAKKAAKKAAKKPAKKAAKKAAKKGKKR